VFRIARGVLVTVDVVVGRDSFVEAGHVVVLPRCVRTYQVERATADEPGMADVVEVSGTGREPRRRAADSTVRQLLLRSLGSAGDGEVGVRRLGLWLMTLFVATILGASPVLATSGRAWLTLLGVCVGVLIACVVAVAAPPAWWQGRGGLYFPFVVMLGLGVASAGVHGLAAPLVGLLTLCFAHIGVTQKPGTALLALAPASATFVWTNGTWDHAIAIRLVIGLVIWLLLAELLAALASMQRVLTEELRAAANTDALTGLANRRDLEIQLTATQAGDVVILADLDHFKRVNDQLGHAVGDQVLADFGRTLRLTLRTGDYCARFGGEEFMIILHDATAQHGMTLIGRLRTMWAALHPDITFSAGIASCDTAREPAGTLAAADAALYGAKRAGRNCTHVEGPLPRAIVHLVPTAGFAIDDLPQ
jgi:diguanylate cyclase (GGDEF)-like protein